MVSADWLHADELIISVSRILTSLLVVYNIMFLLHLTPFWNAQFRDALCPSPLPPIPFHFHEIDVYQWILLSSVVFYTLHESKLQVAFAVVCTSECCMISHLTRYCSQSASMHNILMVCINLQIAYGVLISKAFNGCWRMHHCHGDCV